MSGLISQFYTLVSLFMTNNLFQIALQTPTITKLETALAMMHLYETSYKIMVACVSDLDKKCP